ACDTRPALNTRPWLEASTPEPGTITLACLGAAGLGAYRSHGGRWQRRSSAAQYHARFEPRQHACRGFVRFAHLSVFSLARATIPVSLSPIHNQLRRHFSWLSSVGSHLLNDEDTP